MKEDKKIERLWGIACPGHDDDKEDEECPGIMIATRPDGVDCLILFYSKEAALHEAHRKGFKAIKQVTVFVSDLDEKYEE